MKYSRNNREVEMEKDQERNIAGVFETTTLKVDMPICLLNLFKPELAFAYVPSLI